MAVATKVTTKMTTRKKKKVEKEKSKAKATSCKKSNNSNDNDDDNNNYDNDESTWIGPDKNGNGNSDGSIINMEEFAWIYYEEVMRNYCIHLVKHKGWMEIHTILTGSRGNGQENQVMLALKLGRLFLDFNSHWRKML